MTRGGIARVVLAAVAVSLAGCSRGETHGREAEAEAEAVPIVAAADPWPTAVNALRPEPTAPPEGAGSRDRPAIAVDAVTLDARATATVRLGPSAVTATLAFTPSSAPPDGAPLRAPAPASQPPPLDLVAAIPAPDGAAAPPPASAGEAAHRLAGLTHTWQKWNNCGPSTAVMALSAFGIVRDQLAAAAELKPHDRDTNVTPEELAAYMSRQGLEALVRPGGDRDRTRALVRAGVPVLAEQWIAVDGRGEMGHYRVLDGYDDGAGMFEAMDSYYGASVKLPYDVLEAEWRPFVGTYVVAFLPEQRDAVRAALGDDWDAGAAWARVRGALEADAVGARAGEAWTWFALGEARERTLDADGAVAAFERAIAIGLPLRAFWYQFGFARALAGTGGWDRLLAHADATITTMDGQNLEEWHYWRGRALRALGREDEAIAAFERALSFNANLAVAAEALGRR